MGDILDELRSPSFPVGQRFALCQEAADEIVRLRAELAQMNADADAVVWDRRGADYWRPRADRAEADADRLAASVSRRPCACTWRSHGVIGYRCVRCATLDLHDKEVEAR